MRFPDTFHFKSPKPLSYNYHGFTLVELIVVITILVILGTIAFISVGGYSSNARDSSRISDIGNLSRSLELASISLGSYPLPDNFFTVTYSGGTIWTQGTIGDSLVRKIGKINKKPVDPLDSTEYTYSVTASQREYSIKGNYEGNTIASVNSLIIPSVNANAPTLSYIKGNYNGVVAKAFTGNRVYVFAIPSLFLSSGTGIVLLPTTTATGFYIHGQTNSGGILFQPNIIFSSGSLPSNDSEHILFSSWLALSYSGTSLASNTQIQSFITALGANDTSSLVSLGESAVINWLGGGGMVQTSPLPAASWTTSGGDCTAVNNALGTDGNSSICTDNRTYAHVGTGAIHDRTYSLLKIAGKWWFNENLAYPLPNTSKYQWDGSWSGSDVGYYSCPGNNSLTTADCTLVSSLGYLYQWSAATGVASNNNDAITLQWICPNGWHIPKKSDLSTASSTYWPDPLTDNAWSGSTNGWTRSYIGYRLNEAIGRFSARGDSQYIWSSFDAPSASSWAERFWTGYPTQSFRYYYNKAHGFSVRCLKD